MTARAPLAPDDTSGLPKVITSPDTIDSTLLENVVTAGSVGDATHIPVITYDAHGRITGTSSVATSSSPLPAIYAAS